MGTLRITLDGKPLVERPIVALQEYPEGGFMRRLGDGIMLWFKSDEAVQPSKQPDTR